MSAVSREDLEQRLSITEAVAVVQSFLEDTDAYPYEDFILRRGINKVIAEEYLPLVRVAANTPGALNVHLSQQSNEGPDGVIEFESGDVWQVQITCSHEGQDRALMREQMRNGEVTGSGRRHRDKSSRKVVYEPEGFLTQDDVTKRVDRVLDAIRKKESKYRDGTDTLIVLDEPDGFDYLREGRLRERVRQGVLEASPSHYKRIFVVYGVTSDRVA